MPEVVEAGTLNTHGIAALGAGIDYVMEAGPDRIWAYESCLANVFAIELMSFENVTVYGDLAQPHVGIVSVNVKDKDSSEVGAELSEQGICVRCGTHCAPLAHDSLGTHEQGVVRFSFGYHNTLEEVYKAVDLVGRISIES
jgi:selenocysteine lyase/cysteine desulfurase